MQKHANLVAYRDRMTSTYFADQPVARVVDPQTSGARRLAHG